MRASTRRGGILGVLVLAALLVAYLLWPKREATWTVAIESDHVAVTPWQTTQLVARIEPSIEGTESWHYTWQDGGRTFATTKTPPWRSGTTGEHHLHVTVVSSSGRTATAELAIDVLYKPFVSPIGPQAASELASDPAPANLPYGIEDIWVEKSEVCQGEPSRIRLKAFDKRGEQKWLVPQVADSQAWETSFVVALSEPGMRAVPVQVSGTEGAATTYVMIEVKDCVAPFPMYLDHAAIPPHNDYFSFSARLLDGPGWVAWSHQGEGGPLDQPMTGHVLPIAKAAKLRWTFGDGTAVTTTEPTVNHRYPAEADRPDEAATTYAVQAEAIDDKGAVMATAYGGVRVVNVLRDLKHTNHIVQLVTDQTPWSTESADGSRTADVTLLNIDPTETVSLDPEVTVALKPCDGSTPTTRKLALHDVFAVPVLHPRERAVGHFTLPKDEIARICWADAEIAGHTSPANFRAVAFFTLDAGKQPAHVYDEEQTKLMMKVMDLLGNPPAVSDDQIRQLEDAGKIPRGVLLRPHTDATSPLR
jgi:PKD domain